MEPEEKIDLSSLSRINDHHSDGGHSFLVWKSQLEALLDLKESLHCLHCAKPMAHDFSPRHNHNHHHHQHSHYAPSAAVVAALASSRVAHQQHYYNYHQHHSTTFSAAASATHNYHRSSMSPNDDLPLNLICTSKKLANNNSNKNLGLSDKHQDLSLRRNNCRMHEDDDDNNNINNNNNDHDDEDDENDNDNESSNGRRNSDCIEEEAPSPVENCEPRNLKKSFMKRYRKFLQNSDILNCILYLVRFHCHNEKNVENLI